jgi:hypothetical protein
MAILTGKTLLLYFQPLAQRSILRSQFFLDHFLQVTGATQDSFRVSALDLDARGGTAACVMDDVAMNHFDFFW